MSGRAAAYKVAIRNARRNRRRTIFLVLLVAVPVAFGVVVAGVVRASSLTPEEDAQTYFGSADARVQIYSPESGAGDWVRETVDEIAPDVEITELRQTGLRLAEAGYTTVWDLDMSDPATTGFLVEVSGRTPNGENEVAISPAVAEALGVGVGDTLAFDDLPYGELTVVGLISRPFFQGGADVLMSPGALASLVGDPRFLPEPSLLLSGPNAGDVAHRVNELWYSEGQAAFWPEPAVSPVPPELEFMDEQTYIMLDEEEISELVELVRESGRTPEEVPSLVYPIAHDMIYGEGRFTGLPEVYVETRDQWLSRGGFESNPAIFATAASAIVLVEVAFITGAAFAAGTRRRLREIGLMGANGASEKHVRATVLGEGLTIGALGAGLGVALGLVVMVLGRPLLQRFVSRVIVGLGVSLTDVAGPVLVALVSVVIAVLVPARTASKVPITTALQGRMPALSPRKWVIPVGVALSAGGALLTSVALVSSSNLAGLLVGVGAAAIVGGIAMLSSPILAGLTRLSDRVTATSRLVLRDSGRNRTRSAVAVAAIMVILLAPVTAMVTSATTTEKNLIYGLPSPSDQIVLRGSYDSVGFGTDRSLSDSDIATLAAIVPEREVAVFDTLDLRVLTNEALATRETLGEELVPYDFTDGYAVAVANEELVSALGDTRVEAALDSGQVVILGIEEKATRVEIDGVEHQAQEYPVPVLQWSMPRVLIPESRSAEFAAADSQRLALFVLERPMSDDEWTRMWNEELRVDGGHGHISEATVYLVAGALTLIVVLIVVALVTAVSAAEVDHDLRTIVAVGAPGSIRRRFLGLLTGYQTLVAMLLAVPLGLGLVWVFSSAQDHSYGGPFGVVNNSDMTIPWAWLIPFAVLLPVVIGLLTMISVRSAPVTPPRRAT